VESTTTVALLLTDVAGSTRLWQDCPAEMALASRRHDELVDAAVHANAGTRPVDQGEGDSRFAVFPSVGAALTAALELQRSLVGEHWPTPEPLSVRIAVHVGDVLVRSGNYYGDAVGRCARLRDLAHGGQVVVSGAASTLLGDRLPPGATLRDLGEHRLRDLARLERVFQLLHPDLPDTFPPLRSLGGGRASLPVPLSSFVGRAPDVAAVTELLRQHRLVTVTGFGGVGKTRLAVEVAAGPAGSDCDAVLFVDLAPLRDPRHVVPAVAEALDVRGATADVVSAVAAKIGGSKVLVLLDNAEQVVAAGSSLVELLARTPDLRLLVTSREALRVRGEREYVLEPLSVPDARAPGGVGVLDTYESVTLFIDRATAVDAGFQVTNETAPAVAAICARLEGLPLAIELAAARVKLLSPKALLARLNDQLSLLSGGARDLPDRHQTLRATIAWSHDLLPAPEQRLFARLSVFAGGASVEAVEAVCGPDLGADPLTALGSLVDKSLVRQRQGDDGETRFTLFETLREFAAEQLAAAPDAAAVRSRHATYFRDAVAERVVGRLTEAATVSFVDLELDNIRAALATFAATGDAAGEAQLLADIADAVWHRGHWAELVERAADVLRRTPRPTETSFTLLDCLGVGSLSRRDHDAAETWLREAAAEAAALDRPVLQGRALVWLGHLLQVRGDLDGAEQSVRTGLDLAGRPETAPPRYAFYDREPVLCEGEAMLAGLAVRRGEWAAAADLAALVVDRARRTGDYDNEIRGHVRAASAALGAGRHDDACRAFSAAVTLCREHGVRGYLPTLMTQLAEAQRRSGDWAAALATVAGADSVLADLGDSDPMLDAVAADALLDAGEVAEAAARLASAPDDADPESAVRLLLARARVAEASARDEEAESLLRDALALTIEPGAAAGRATALRRLARLRPADADRLTTEAAAAVGAPGPVLLRLPA
jgi:predicted ATPase/class 3 adenylate cyclase